MNRSTSGGGRGVCNLRRFHRDNRVRVARDEAVDRMCAAIAEFGFRIPVVARSDGTVVDGHLRLT